MGWGLAEWIKCVLYKHEGPGLKPENPCKLRIGCASVTSEPLQGDGKQRQERGPASPVYAAASKQRPSFKRGRRPGLMPGVVSSPQTVASTNVHSCAHAHTPPSHTCTQDFKMSMSCSFYRRVTGLVSFTEGHS